MSITFSCTACGKGFRVPDDMAGKKGKCPQCQTVFRIPVEGKAAAKKRAKGALPPSQADAFAFDAPGAALEDFSSEVAASTGGAPLAPPRKGGGKMMLLVYTFVFLVVAGTVGAAIVFRGQLIAPPGINSDLMYLPNHCQVLLSFNVSNTMGSPVYKRLKEELGVDPSPHVEQTVQILKPEEIHRITIGVAMADPLPQAIVVLRAKKPMYAGEVKRALEENAKAFKPLNLQEQKVGDFSVYADNDWAFCLPHELTLVTGQPDVVKAVMERHARPEFSPPLNLALKQIDFEHASFALALEPTPLAQAAQKAAPLAAGMAPVKIPTTLPIEQIDSVEVITLQVLLNDPFEFKAIAYYKDPKTARDAEKQIQDLLAVGRTGLQANAEFKTLATIVEGIKAATKSNRLILTYSGGLDAAVAIGKQLGQMGKPPAQPPMPMPMEEKPKE